MDATTIIEIPVFGTRWSYKLGGELANSLKTLAESSRKAIIELRDGPVPVLIGDGRRDYHLTFCLSDPDGQEMTDGEWVEVLVGTRSASVYRHAKPWHGRGLSEKIGSVKIELPEDNQTKTDDQERAEALGNKVLSMLGFAAKKEDSGVAIVSLDRLPETREETVSILVSSAEPLIAQALAKNDILEIHKNANKYVEEKTKGLPIELSRTEYESFCNARDIRVMSDKDCTSYGVTFGDFSYPQYQPEKIVAMRVARARGRQIERLEKEEQTKATDDAMSRKFAEAQKTGRPVLISKVYGFPSGEYEDDDVSGVYYQTWAMPDGTIKEDSYPV